MIYLDAAATAPLQRAALEALWPLLTSNFGNPSSHHAPGEAAAAALEDARRTVARILGCRASEITFTSGGTESNNFVLKGIALAAPRGRHIVTSPIEHAAVSGALDYLTRFHGFRVSTVPVTPEGIVSLAALEKVLTPETTLCTLMYANNEVGTVQPIDELAGVCAAAGVYFHSDTVQAAGWLPLGVGALGVDSLSISGHKLGAPKGIGAVYLRGRVPCEPLQHGGGQERGRRSGTENVAGAAALAAALDLAQGALPEAAQLATVHRDALIEHILTHTPNARLTGHPTRRLPGLASFCFPGVSGEAVLLELERLGVVASSGSACAAGSDEPSAVLLALGIDPGTAQSALRLSWTRDTPAEELEEAAHAVVAAVHKVRGLRSGRPTDPVPAHLH
ncbi:cysteine desulfurase family protein [Arthrobacter sp. Br18]|uniref:cysteine desulfurase family protein n=1 Tax=Arthrobacter sp. Br18 TaxID=1312954 RepID=UPI0004798964|nr:cysteine desulfurase family protein [Arthrobacter sp. Br18]